MAACVRHTEISTNGARRGMFIRVSNCVYIGAERYQGRRKRGKMPISTLYETTTFCRVSEHVHGVVRAGGALAYGFWRGPTQGVWRESYHAGLFYVLGQRRGLRAI